MIKKIEFEKFKWLVICLLCMNLFHVSDYKAWAVPAAISGVVYIIELAIDIFDYISNKRWRDD